MILVLDATFVLKLPFLGLLSPDTSFEEKKVTHSPSLFRHPQTSARSTEEFFHYLGPLSLHIKSVYV